MKNIATRKELAVEMGLSEAKLAQVFGDYEKVCANPKSDPFGKKLYVSFIETIELELTGL